MCRDYSKIDEFALNLGLSRIRIKSGPGYDGEIATLGPILKQAEDHLHTEPIMKLQKKLEDLKLSIPNKTEKQVEEITKQIFAVEKELQVFLDADKKLADQFAQQLFLLAINRQVVTEFEDHIARARLFCVWLAGSLAYDYTQRTIDAYDESTPAGWLRTDATYCAGYSKAFVDMFNAVSAHSAAQENDDFVATCFRGDTKKTSRAGDVDGHSWAKFPSVTNAAGSPTEWKVVDPCWMTRDHGPAQVFTDGVATEWFCNSNHTFMRTHLAGGLMDRLPPASIPGSVKEFMLQDLAPFRQPPQFQIEESSLAPQSFLIEPRETQKFSFSRVCQGARKFPTTPYLVPMKDNIGWYEEARAFDSTSDQMTYIVISDTLRLAQNFKGKVLGLVIAFPFDSSGKPMQLNNRNGGSSVIQWEIVASWQVK